MSILQTKADPRHEIGSTSRLAANQMRAALAHAFPNVKFTVKSSSITRGAMIKVDCALGPDAPKATQIGQVCVPFLPADVYFAPPTDQALWVLRAFIEIRVRAPKEPKKD